MRSNGFMCVARAFCGMLLLAGGSSVASADVTIFNNGPFITSTGNGAGGADVSLTETSAGALAGVSFKANLASPARVTDNFVVSNAVGAGARLSNLHFYSFQQNAPTTAQYQAVYITLYDARPSDGGNVIAGDFTTNRLLSTTWSGAYRVSGTVLTGTTRPIYQLDIDMSWAPPLPNGTYWIMLSAIGDLDVSASANPFFFFISPHTSGNGGLGGPDNAQQLFNGSYFDVFEVPFSMFGFCPGDYNKSHAVTVQDIFDFLAGWFAGSPAADFNGVNGISVQDIFDFLSAWFAGCE